VFVSEHLLHLQNSVYYNHIVTKHGSSFAHKPQHWAYLNTSSLEHTPLYCQSTARQPFVLQKPPSSHNLRKEIFHRGIKVLF